MGQMEERFDWFERVELDLQDFPSQGWVLDIGGGGEGVIGRLKGSAVVAIDLYKQELEEAPAGPLKITSGMLSSISTIPRDRCRRWQRLVMLTWGGSGPRFRITQN